MPARCSPASQGPSRRPTHPHERRWQCEEYFFDTWYHEDTWMTQGGLMTEPEWIANGQIVKKESKEKIQFYGFFKQIGLVS